MEGDSRFRLDDFELYKLAREFRKKIYALIKRLPVEERYCLDKQMRKAAVSVTNNIAEGHGRWHYQENTHFCLISRGSVAELIDDLNVCLDERYADEATLLHLKEDAYSLIHRINGYLSYLDKCKQ